MFAMSDLNQQTLDLIEIFASVQGETSFAGLPTTFIRLARCNLRCTWCDTPYSFGRGTPHTLGQILEQVSINNCPYVCVTGGEPLLQGNIHPLLTELCDRNYLTSLETGGSLTTRHVDPRVHIILDIKCPGSGMSHKNDWNNLKILRPHDQIKFVILDEQDYLYAKDVCHQHQLIERGYEVLFSPVHGDLDPKQLVNWMLRDQIRVRLNLQIHKFIWSPTTRGV